MLNFRLRRRFSIGYAEISLTGEGFRRRLVSGELSGGALADKLSGAHFNAHAKELRRSRRKVMGRVMISLIVHAPKVVR